MGLNDLIELYLTLYKIKVIQVVKGDEYCRANGEESYINKSYSCGKKIYLGIYEDAELKLISFFHEVGHCIDKIKWDTLTTATKHDQEDHAWTIGYALAKGHGIKFSATAIFWSKTQLEGYHG